MRLDMLEQFAAPIRKALALRCGRAVIL